MVAMHNDILILSSRDSGVSKDAMPVSDGAGAIRT